MYITDRDRDILRWIEKYRSLSLINAADIFFNGNKGHASRRLNQLTKANILNSYKTNYEHLNNQEKIYILPGTQKVKEHELIRENFRCSIIKNEGEIIEEDINLSFPIWYTEKGKLHKAIKPDLVIKYTINGLIFTILLEIDYTHNTPVSKQREIIDDSDTFNKITDTLKERFDDPYWRLVIASSNTIVLDHFRIVKTDLNFTDINDKLQESIYE